MRRKLFTFAAGASVVLCAGVCVLWVRSYWRADTLAGCFGRDGWDQITSERGSVLPAQASRDNLAASRTMLQGFRSDIVYPGSACAWAQAYYQRHRAAGQSHACALRCLGQRWLKILWTMWQRRATYDEARRLADQHRYAPPPAPVTPGGGAK